MTVPHAEEIELFICEPCEQETGKRAIMYWEVIDADAYYQEAFSRKNRKPKTPKIRPNLAQFSVSDGETGGDTSETSVSARELESEAQFNSESTGTDSESDDPRSITRKSRTAERYSRLRVHLAQQQGSKSRSNSPSESFFLQDEGRPRKRKAGHAVKPSKKPKTTRSAEVPSASNDPARKYCLSQLESVLLPIFVEFHRAGSISSLDFNQLSSEYARNLESHLFEQFAELDKSGTLAVAHRYKTQFRALTFNIEKPDRQVLRRRIGEGELKAIELSAMSNAELASDQQKKDMESAHKESLHHSILQDRGVDRPLRKTTHKGEEEIYRAMEPLWSLTDTSALALNVSSNKPLSSPFAPQSPTSPISPSVRRESDIVAATHDVSTLSKDHGLANHPSSPDTEMLNSYPSVSPVESDLASTSRFDISTIAWSAEDDHGATGGSPLLESQEPDLRAEDMQSSDHDFNEFLDDGQLSLPSAQSPGPIRPILWSGELQMPSGTGQSTIAKVDARVVAGRPLSFVDHAYWSSLLPNAHLVIEGRVPTTTAEIYLLNSRLNSGRELVAVSFTPVTPSDRPAYDELADGLLNKGRHAVILPWGNPPKPDAPGKELYLVPLKPSDAPEYLEMLEHLSLPARRQETLLVGVFILHKPRKVAPAPAIQPSTPLSSQPSTSLGFDLSALTPDFVAQLLATNPAISAAASATFPSGTGQTPFISVLQPYPQNYPTGTQSQRLAGRYPSASQRTYRGPSRSSSGFGSQDGGWGVRRGSER